MSDLAALGRRFQPSTEVDFVIVGSGAAGGVVARELSRAGFSVVVLEQGAYLTRADFHHDDLDVIVRNRLAADPLVKPQTWRATPDDKAEKRTYLVYGTVVGGGSVHFAANYWRFREIDFVERSRKGAVDGTTLEDWPITYADLEPYYTRVEWEVGVAGLAGVNPKDPPRSRPFPLPPHAVSGPGALLDIGAKKLGWLSQPSPMAILSRPYRGREACARCGFCWGFGCEWGAKSSSLAAMIPPAVATGRCEIRPRSYARRIETDVRGRVTGVTYFDARRREVMQRAKAVVLCANGAESPRLLLMSDSSRFPQGLANSSGLVGKNLMPNGGSVAGGLFEHEVNGFLGPPVTRIVLEHYELEQSLGIAGGAGIDFRFAGPGPLIYAMFGLPEDAPKWGSARKEMLREYYSRSMMALTHTTTLPQERNSISLDPELKDAWGLPAIRTTYREHPNDVNLMRFIQDRAVELIDAAGAKRSWRLGVTDDPGGLYHLLGTCRMGNDPAKSVVDRYHRAHDVQNLFIVDGSSFVTSGRGQPTMTIQALAFRAAEHIAAAAKRRDI